MQFNKQQELGSCYVLLVNHYRKYIESFCFFYRVPSDHQEGELHASCNCVERINDHA